MNMRWLCDENIPAAIILALRATGDDVLSIVETSRGMTDRDVAALARRDGRVCVTCDKDFGSIAGHAAQAPGFGVVLLRVALHPVATAAPRVAAILKARDDWPGHVSVIEAVRIRMRKLGST